MTVGRAIKELREILSVTREQVSRWDTGKRTPGPYWLRHLATALQASLYALECDDVERRTFITDLVATVVAPVVASDLLSHGFATALRRRPNVDAWQYRLATYGLVGTT